MKEREITLLGLTEGFPVKETPRLNHEGQVEYSLMKKEEGRKTTCTDTKVKETGVFNIVLQCYSLVCV
jgi:hypothetical protein